MFYNILRYLAIILCLGASAPLLATNGITYGLSGGRFGDNIRAYTEARWLAYKNQLEFFYTPFEYSSQLALHTSHPAVDSHSKKNTRMVTDARQVTQRDLDTLFITKAYPSNNIINFDDKAFYALLKQEIAPLTPLPSITIPKDHYSIAVHVRRGGGWDRKLCQADTISNAKFSEELSCSYVDRSFPRKFPPDSYYIEQLEYVTKLHLDKKIYIYLFTDDPEPATIVEKYQKALTHPALVFEYRTQNNAHNAHVLEDFFAMMHFDCLIRSTSHFSTSAGILGRIKLDIGPEQHVWHGNTLYITGIRITERKDSQGSLRTIKRMKRTKYYCKK